MKRKSIRWRLPASFAGVALLAALILGSIMMLVLREYYLTQEQEYLQNNAEGMKDVIHLVIQSEQSKEEKQEQLTSLSFLSQMQIRVLDSSNQVILDSGQPTITSIIGISDDDKGLLIMTAPFLSQNSMETTISVYEADPALQTTPQVIQLPSTEKEFYTAVFEAGALGIGIFTDGYSPVRSHQKATVNLDSNGTLLELSNGPAFGTGILLSVLTAWIISSVIAVALSALAGWRASRQVIQPVMQLHTATERMQQGDLTTRVVMDQAKQITEFNELASSFNNMAQQVETNINTLRSFVADAAHEINTPLTALQTNLEMIKSGKESQRNEEFLEHALEQSERLHHMAEHLLDLSRIEASGIRLNLTEIQVDSLLQEISVSYASRCDQKDIEFILKLPDQPVNIKGNALYLRQAIENILENSVKFTPDGGSIHLILSQENQGYRIRITDTGIGIPIEDIPQLFHRFHRGRNVAVYNGNGLGLSISRACVQAMGGTIKIESYIDKGTQVDILMKG